MIFLHLGTAFVVAVFPFVFPAIALRYSKKVGLALAASAAIAYYLGSLAFFYASSIGIALGTLFLGFGHNRAVLVSVVLVVISLLFQAGIHRDGFAQEQRQSAERLEALIAVVRYQGPENETPFSKEMENALLELQSEIQAPKWYSIFTLINHRSLLTQAEKVLDDQKVELPEWQTFSRYHSRRDTWFGVPDFSMDSAGERSSPPLTQDMIATFESVKKSHEEILSHARRGTLPCPPGAMFVDNGPPKGSRMFCMINGVRWGAAASFPKQGSRQTIQSYNYLKGRIHGEVVSWNKDDQAVSRTRYENGKMLVR